MIKDKVSSVPFIHIRVEGVATLCLQSARRVTVGQQRAAPLSHNKTLPYSGSFTFLVYYLTQVCSCHADRSTNPSSYHVDRRDSFGSYHADRNPTENSFTLKLFLNTLYPAFEHNLTLRLFLTTPIVNF